MCSNKRRITNNKIILVSNEDTLKKYVSEEYVKSNFIGQKYPDYRFYYIHILNAIEIKNHSIEFKLTQIKLIQELIDNNLLSIIINNMKTYNQNMYITLFQQQLDTLKKYKKIT